MADSSKNNFGGCSFHVFSNRKSLNEHLLNVHNLIQFHVHSQNIDAFDSGKTSPGPMISTSISLKTSLSRKVSMSLIADC